MPTSLFRASLHILRAALVAALIAGYGTATAGIIFIICSDGSMVMQQSSCPVKKDEPAVTQPGVINNTVSGAVVDLDNTIGSAISGAFGGGAGGTQTSSTARGINRTALSFGETGAAAAAGRPRWNVWGAFTQVAVGYSFQPLQVAKSTSRWAALTTPLATI